MVIVGKLDVLIRAEYTDKFQELIRRLRIYQRQAYRILLINHSSVLLPVNMYNVHTVNTPMLSNIKDLEKYDIIYINQSNLFTDLNNSNIWVDNGHHVILG